MKKIKIYYLFFIFMLTIGAFRLSNVIAEEASSSIEKKIIKYVDVRDNKTVSSAKILSKLKTKRGDIFLNKVVNEDIKRLYLLGFFSDVTVTIEDIQDGVGVIFVVTEKPPLQAIEFSGNRVYRDKKLMAAVSSKLNEFVDERKIKKDTEAIEDLYKKAGYPWVKVTYEIKIDKEKNGGTVIFMVDENQKAVVKKVMVIGNIAFSEKRLLKVLKSKPAGFFRSGVYKQEVAEDDMERIKSFYKKDGFLDVESNYEIVSHENGRKKWIELVIRIEEGRQYIAGTVAISGNTVFSEDELKALLTMHPGDVFTEVALHGELIALQDYYFDKGYIMARVKPDTFLNVQTDRMDIKYDIIEGEVCYVNKIDIKGNTKTKDVVIRREIRIDPGERYDGAKLRKSKERLYNLGFFEDITFDVKDTDEKTKKDMDVEVKESKTGEFSFGGGFSSIDKLIGFIEVSQHNFDLFNFPSFTGDGQDLKLRAELGSVRKNYLLSWTEPWIFDHPISFGFDLYATELSRSGSTGYAYDEQREGGAIRLGKEINDYLRGDFTYRLEAVDISDLSDTASQSLKDEEGKKTISSVFFQLTQDTRDNHFNPIKGIVLSGSVELAGGLVGGDQDFVKWYSTFSHYSAIGPFVLEVKSRNGIVSSFGSSGSVPIYERFFAGGTYTIRGYKERDVGPKDQSGDPVGGGTLFVNTAELTFSIVQNLKGAFFVDAGNVWHSPDSRPDNGAVTRGIKVGVGTGVRIKTPIGPVKLDFGVPINQDSHQDDKGRFHFSMSRGF